MRRKQWMIVALVLLPSVLAITTLSVLQSRDAASGGDHDLVPPHLLEGSGTSGDASGSQGESSSEVTAPREVDSHDPSLERDPDPEYRPIIHDVLLADNRAPTIILDEYSPESWRSSPQRNLYASSGGSAGQFVTAAGGAGAGGASPSKSGHGSNGSRNDPAGNKTTEGSSAGGTPGNSAGDSTDKHSDEFANGHDDVEDDPQRGSDHGPGANDGSGANQEPDSSPTNPSGDDSNPADEDRGIVDLYDPIVGDDPIYIPPFDTSEKPHVSVPEPGTLGLFAIAALGMGLSRRRRLGARERCESSCIRS